MTDLGGKPLYVLTVSDGNKAGWTEAQDHLAGLSTDSVHLVVQGSTHTSLIDEREDAAVASRSILAVVQSIRNAVPLDDRAGTP